MEIVRRAIDVFHKSSAETITPKHILKKFRKLEKTGSGSKHADRFYELRCLAQTNQDQLYELIFSGLAREDELHDLIYLGKAHGGTYDEKENLNWVDFVARVRERKDEFPQSVQDRLDWFEETYGW